jgi:ubiquinone/menaquinone biosynthesis C-methylase UbiE
VKRAENAIEYIDRPLPAADLAATLADVERLNERFGGHRLTLAAVARLASRAPRERPLLVLDVGGGRGDLAIHLVRWARRHGRAMRVVVLDRDAATVEIARRHCAPYPEIAIVQGDATALPIGERAVDVAVTVLTLHHLEPDAAAAALDEMRAASRVALVVNDLLRTWTSWLLVWLATRLFARHRVSRHDGPLSVRRAYSAPELAVLAGKARLTTVVTRRFPWCARVLMVAS